MVVVISHLLREKTTIYSNLYQYTNIYKMNTILFGWFWSLYFLDYFIINNIEVVIIIINTL